MFCTLEDESTSILSPLWMQLIDSTLLNLLYLAHRRTVSTVFLYYRHTIMSLVTKIKTLIPLFNSTKHSIFKHSTDLIKLNIIGTYVFTNMLITDSYRLQFPAFLRPITFNLSKTSSLIL